MAKSPKNLVSAKEFLHAYLAMERPNTTHLFYSKGLLDFLVGMLIGVVIGIIVASYI
jgi:F0F1-type ATP synthase assembly protein I